MKIDAAMRVVSFGISYGGWPLHMRFKLFQGSNLVPLIAGLQGYVMLPFASEQNAAERAVVPVLLVVRVGQLVRRRSGT